MEIKPSSLNEYQLWELEYETDRYPDIVPLALKRMRLKNIAEVDGDNFFRFWHIFLQEKWAKYESSTNGK